MDKRIQMAAMSGEAVRRPESFVVIHVETQHGDKWTRLDHYLALEQNANAIAQRVAELEHQLDGMTECAKNHDYARTESILREAKAERTVQALREALREACQWLDGDDPSDRKCETLRDVLLQAQQALDAERTT